MIEDVYEPLARYRDEFKEKFAQLTREKFQSLTEKSGIDVDANRQLVGQTRKLERKASSHRFKKTWLTVLMLIGFVGCAILAACAFSAADSASMWAQILGALAGLAIGGLTVSPLKSVSRSLAKTESEIRHNKSIGWQQMEALNRLYTWDITPRLVEATVPRLAFDPYLTLERLTSLREQFGWDDEFNDGKSIIYAQSGVINGNPFVFGRYLEMEWGEKRYEGTKEISWSEWEEDSNGKRRLVRRHETLHAYVTKPVPVYNEGRLLVYGNDAAPNLSFSREPSGLTGADNGIVGKIRKSWRLSRLKSYSQNLTDDSDFTLMSNHEFETWFHAKDRDNEVEFRLMFTPIAQTQMMNLMKDTTVGYGDDFAFLKQCKINVLLPQHLYEADFNTNPKRFRNWDYDAAAKYFQEFNESYFKHAYFALAPLLSIPLYQQTRTHEEIWKGVIDKREASFWEHESLANYHGEGHFKDPRCITRNILKTQMVSREDGESTVAVTAHGFEGAERVDYEEVYGGDGNWHSVPVPWTEYLAVERTSEMRVSERETPTEDFRTKAEASAVSAFRRSILSFLPAE